MSHGEIHWLGTNEGGSGEGGSANSSFCKRSSCPASHRHAGPVRMRDLIPGGYPELWSHWALSPLLSSKTSPMHQLNTCDDRWEHGETRLLIRLKSRHDNTIKTRLKAEMTPRASHRSHHRTRAEDGSQCTTQRQYSNTH